MISRRVFTFPPGSNGAIVDWAVFGKKLRCAGSLALGRSAGQEERRER